MSRLITFGCSNTYGEGLPDCWLSDQPGTIASKLAWPSVLADKLSLPIVNLAEPGVSNKFIWNKVINTEFQQDDIVIILWTYLSRHCFFDEYGNHHRLLPSDIDKSGKEKIIRIRTKFFYTHFYSEKDSIDDNFLRFDHTKTFLDKKNIKNYHFICDGHIENVELPSWNSQIPALMTFRDIGTPALDNMHPGIESQKDLANRIFNHINN